MKGQKKSRPSTAGESHYSITRWPPALNESRGRVHLILESGLGQSLLPSCGRLPVNIAASDRLPLGEFREPSRQGVAVQIERVFNVNRRLFLWRFIFCSLGGPRRSWDYSLR